MEISEIYLLCVEVLTKTLNKIKGVSVKDIDLKSGQVSFANDGADDKEIHQKINDLGYTVEYFEKYIYNFIFHCIYFPPMSDVS